MDYDIKPGTIVSFVCIKDNKDSVFDKKTIDIESINDPEEKRKIVDALASSTIEKEISWMQEQNHLEDVANSWVERLQRKIDRLVNRDITVAPIVKDNKITLELKIPVPIEVINYPVKIILYSKNKKRKNIRNMNVKQIKKILNFNCEETKIANTSN